jgi:hypothetical protein
MFRKAERKKAKLRLALDGPAGSGKTLGALYVATGLGGKIAMIDTERGSGELYSDKAEYDVAQIYPPFSPDKYITAIKEAEKAGYAVLIIDSLSHAWEGEGGLLDMHDKATKAQRQQNSFTAWKEITPLHNELVNTILQSDLHVIITLRTKTAYEITKDESGKTKPVKIGTKPIFREGVEYEFTRVLDLSVEGHIATSSKDRTGLFDGKHIILSKETGSQLLEWLESGVDADAAAREAVKDMIERINKIENLFELRNWWKKHQAEIDALKLVDRTLVVSAKDTRKAELEKKEQTGKAQSAGG